VSLVAHLGYQSVRNNTNLNYTDFKVGGTVDAAGVTWGAAFITTNARSRYYTPQSLSCDGSSKVISKSTLVLSVGKTF
jgi:hypothetical protein